MSFQFEGKDYRGYAGDTLASALAASGQWLLSRSFKYHRPRAALTFAGLEANSYVQVGDRPNVLADLLPIADGLSAVGQNYLGSLNRDYAIHAGRLARFLPVGFYYRAFFRPQGIWPLWERFFRRAAGLGKINPNADPGYFDKQYLFADVAVIGGGPAGLSAALSAAGAGAGVVLIEEAAMLGGALNYARFQRERSEIQSLRDDLVARVQANDNIRILAGATCTGWFTDNWLAIGRSNRLYKLRAKYVIACTGSVEQTMVFRNNDLPGVLPASGVQRLLRLYAVRPGKQAVVATANAEGYDAALDLLAAGVSVQAVIDINRSVANPQLAERLSAMGVAVHHSCTVSEAIPGAGLRSITGVVVNQLTESGEVTGDGRKIDCDLLVTSVGYAPLGQLVCHCGGEFIYDDDVNSFSVRNCPPDSTLAGSVNHRYALEAVLADGRSAGLDAARALGLDPAAAADAGPDPGAAGINHPYPIFPHRKGKDFVDFDEDQTVADLQNAVADGFAHAELAKRYSTVGMGPSQGRLSSLNALRIVQRYNGGILAGASVTTQRPPFKPVSFGVLAGRSFEPERLTPMHEWHADHGAVFMPAGMWQRAAHYAGAKDQAAAVAEKIAEEVATIRGNVGVIDVSPLGGIEIRGPDAAEFLNRMYTFAYQKQPVARCRYLLMTDDAGGIIDDGVACRLGDEHFYVTTTTTGSDAVFRNMLRRNAEWGLEIDVLNVSSTYAGMNIAGPNSRQLMEQMESDIDFSKDAFPYLAALQGMVNGIPVIAMRVGFVGELGYELHVPWSNALTLWEQLFAAGAGFDIRPVGVEAQRILRLEKGHIIIGQDTDELTMPRDAALDWAVATAKPYFVGKPAIGFSRTRRQSRQLVGFRLLNSNGPLPEESHLVIHDDAIVGRVTSVARSAELGQVIGLAYVAPEQARPGTIFRIKVDKGLEVAAQTVQTPFYDPENLRQAL
ncbi:MAG: (2Fe-2S)-binding protein [Proteobacteria bacterium]|nr:(2Fe-2S)-binding protein [Pseudomonadota bacterium]